MKLNSLNILAFAASASAVSDLLVKNYCSEDIYVTLYHGSSGESDSPFILPSGQAYLDDIVSTGNSATITKNANVFTPIPKLVMGTSTANGILYWSVNNETGDPFADESWNVASALRNGTAPNFCGDAAAYGPQVHGCQDDSVELTLNLC